MKSKNIVLTALILLLLAFIWGNSCLPRSQSIELSDGFASVIFRFIPGFLPSETTSHVVRKIAHLTEFFFLGALLCVRFSKERDFALVSFSLAFSAAVIDETIQVFTLRGPSITDVLIDSTGAVFGVLLICLILYFKRKKTAI